MTVEDIVKDYDIEGFKKAVIAHGDFNEYHIKFVHDGKDNRRSEKIGQWVKDNDEVFRTMLFTHIRQYNIPISKRKVINNILSEI